MTGCNLIVYQEGMQVKAQLKSSTPTLHTYIGKCTKKSICKFLNFKMFKKYMQAIWEEEIDVIMADNHCECINENILYVHGWWKNRKNKETFKNNSHVKISEHSVLKYLMKSNI